MIYGYKNFSGAVKDVDTKQGIVTGYFSAFGMKDSDGDIIHPGAFSKSIQEWGPEANRPRIKHLLNHDTRQPIGKIMVLKEDQFGLYYESKIGSHSLGQDFLKMVESGLVTEHSIGFQVMKEQKGDDANNLIDLKLYEGSSLTSWGANENTPLTGVKELVKRSLAFERFIRSQDVSDETIDLCLLEIKQLNQLVESLKSTVVADEAQRQQKGESKELEQRLINILSKI